MADKKISQLTALSAANLAPSTDVLAIVDTSATETKKIVAQDLINGVLNVASAVGIGTASPSQKLHVVGNALVTPSGGWTTGGVATQYFGDIYGSIKYDYNTTNFLISSYGSFSVATNGTSPTTRLTIDSSGSLGLGVTPSAWTTYTALQIKNGSVANYSPTQDMRISSNAYYTSGAWKRIAAAYAVQYLQDGSTGIHAWFNAGTSTADSTISFTQAMTLDASGRLGVGVTSPDSMVEVNSSTAAYARFKVNYNGSALTYLGSFSGIVGSGNATDTMLASTGVLAFGAGGTTERARITSGGDFLTAGKTSASFTTVGAELLANGQINTATANLDNLNIYNTTAAAYRFYVSAAGTVFATNTTISAISDQRFKENVQDLDVGLNAVMALKPRKFDWKAGKGKDIKGDRGFIAQEFEQVFPDLIDEWKDPAPEGEEPYKAVRADLIPVLVKAIQEQQAMIETLKAKVAALEAK